MPWLVTGIKAFGNKRSCPVTAGCFFNAASTALTVVIEMRVDFFGTPVRKIIWERVTVLKLVPAVACFTRTSSVPQMSALKCDTIVEVLNLLTSLPLGAFGIDSCC